MPLLLIRAALMTALLLMSGTATLAQSTATTSAQTNRLIDALGLPELVAIMREEGIVYSQELEADLFPDRGGARWKGLVGQIYDPARMEKTVRTRFAAELAAEYVTPSLAFFASENGKRIVALEVSARRAMLDASVDEASRAALDAMIQKGDPRLELIREFAEANDLVESNVVGAMNSNYAFYVGLSSGTALGRTLTESQILTDVWSQEDAIRLDTQRWVYSYLALAYRPLSDADLQAYIAFSRTEAGVAMNRALFTAFDELFVAQSQALGQAAASFLEGEDL